MKVPGDCHRFHRRNKVYHDRRERTGHVECESACEGSTLLPEELAFEGEGPAAERATSYSL